MKCRDKFRGHEIELLNGEWIYSDTREPTVNNERPCGRCGLVNSPEGYDGCIRLPEVLVMNACCGHGEENEAYIQYWNGSYIRGRVAIYEIAFRSKQLC